MEFKDGKVACETQYFGDAFEPGLHALSGRADAVKCKRRELAIQRFLVTR